ncbi:Putative uncharacterized protein [Thermobacillus xylanilyticus]|jgi:hypothetical protein|uniref:Lipoprotein n=1 Tax=Thermobacillus xylanilyticus TaxID=76633 RepID=A0ABM8V214_THEXY|nr:hypothetical protein [Thermobacillus xylanilyticus]REJ18753.1 MAG: hypothetical protein C6W59_04960 [Paenibacillaceae bacterium]CAG5082028.1 Putative uncharacterized protein [Thermobacillus xylanilyticus]
MKRVALLLLLLAAAAGCGIEQSSYASILIYQGQEYIGKGLVPQDEYAHAEPVGTVSVKTAPERLPTDELSSNELEAGTEICKADEDMLLAKVNDREYKVFER